MRKHQIPITTAYNAIFLILFTFFITSHLIYILFIICSMLFYMKEPFMV